MRSRRWGPWAGVIIVYVAAACIAVPLWFGLALGLSALGFETGWWPGDYNMNDGEGVPLTLGSLTLLALVAAVAGWGAWHCLGLVEAHRTRRWLPFAASSTLLAAMTALAFITVLAWY